ncbi:MAG: DUF4377 domain-containing protein [Nonlabens sp.]
MQRCIFLLLVSFLIISCNSDDDDSEVVSLKLDHHYAIGFTLDAIPTLRFQEGDAIGGDEWFNFYNGVTGLDYEPGFIYDLRVRKRMIPNPPADTSSIEYILIDLVSKTPVSPQTTFEMDLKGFGQNFIVQENNSYSFLYSIPLDCQILCRSMENMLSMQDEVVGVFTHDGNGGVRLQELR